MLPERIDLRGELGQVGDQGERGTCVAFAATAAHEMSYRPHSVLDLSEETLFWGCVQQGADPQRGTTVDVASTALQRTGQPEAHHWPYDPHRDITRTYEPPTAAIDPQLCYRVRLAPLPESLARIKTELAKKQAVMLGVPIWESIYLAPGGSHSHAGGGGSLARRPRDPRRGLRR